MEKLGISCEKFRDKKEQKKNKNENQKRLSTGLKNSFPKKQAIYKQKNLSTYPPI